MSSILVTGATGTFGHAFLRSCFASGQWSRVIAYSRDEVKQAQLSEEFGHEPALRLFLGDVRDYQRMVMALRGVHTVVHAAALKRVDAGAYSPSEMINTNILGTMNVVNAAIQQRCQRVVVISSDKAVEATNIYGSTKYCGENYAVQANSYGHGVGTKIAAVRYGNILGSRGSVVHVWRSQIQSGKPLTLTSPDMTRFIMTIEQAVDLVWFAAEHMFGGEVFLPLLPTANMQTLATAVAGKDYPVVLTGLRPGGEKMAEALMNTEEVSRSFWIQNDAGRRYLVVLPSHHEWTSGDVWVAAAGEHWLHDNFKYSSDKVVWRLSAEELGALMGETEACR